MTILLVETLYPYTDMVFVLGAGHKSDRVGILGILISDPRSLKSKFQNPRKLFLLAVSYNGSGQNWVGVGYLTDFRGRQVRYLAIPPQKRPSILICILPPMHESSSRPCFPTTVKPPSMSMAVFLNFFLELTPSQEPI
jgi:hypothetical protein